MFWPVVSSAGFVLVVWLVIALGRACTSRWEREHAAEHERTGRRQTLGPARVPRTELGRRSPLRKD